MFFCFRPGSVARFWPVALSVVITDSNGYIITDFNHSTSLPFAISLVSLSNSCVLIPPLKLLHSLSSHDPILTKAGNPLAQISSPWCEALPNETLLVKTVLLLLLLLGLLVCLWAPVKAGNSEYMNMPMDARNNAAPARSSCFAEVARNNAAPAPSSCFAEVAESPAPETDCQNRF